jgi:Calx-beta domain-containing protein
MPRRTLAAGAVITAISAICLQVAGVPPAVPAQAAPITLTQVATGFSNPIGIDYHEPTNKLVLSANYSSGRPHNLALVAPDGSQTPFSEASGLTDEIKIATVRSGPCQGGFTTGELFTGSGRPGVVVRMSPDGSSIQDPWVTLPGETGLLRGSLFQDRYCSFGGDLIVVTTAGGVWRISSAGVPTRLAHVSTHLEGLQVLPDDPRYGPWAGRIVAGAEDESALYAVDAAGNVASYKLGIVPEDVDLIAAGESFYGVDFGGRKVWTAGASQWQSMAGDVLVAQEAPGILFRVRWNARTSSFQTEPLARVAKWEHVTFAPVSIATIGISLSTGLETSTVGAPRTVTAGVVGRDGAPLPGVPVGFGVAGSNAAAAGTCDPPGCLTGPDGRVSFTYTGAAPGTDTLTACFTDPDGNRRCTDTTITWKQPAVSIGDVTVVEGDSGTTPATFTVSLSAPAGPPGVTVEASTVDGEAIAGSDYIAQSGVTLRFAPGETRKSFTVPVIGDRQDEPAETFAVELSAPANASIAHRRGVATIVDDDRGGSFTCRATAVRLGTVELGVANAPADPCADDDGSAGNAVLRFRLVVVASNTLTVTTDQTPDDLESAPPAVGDRGTADARAELVTVRMAGLTLVARVVRATATVECVAGPDGPAPRAVGSSTVGSLTLNGVPVDVSGSGSISLPLGLGSIELNQTMPAESGVTQQAVRLSLLGTDVVIGEAVAGFSGNPCAG